MTHGPTTRLILKRRAAKCAQLAAENARTAPQPVQEPNEELQRYLDALRLEQPVGAILRENVGQRA